MDSSDDASDAKASQTLVVESQATSHYRGDLADPESQNGSVHDQEEIDDHDGDLVTAIENHDLKRGLAERHLTMLGLAGAIGTGLFLSLGSAIQTGGPLGALLGYFIVGMIVCAVQFALGEVTALVPVSSAHNMLLAVFCACLPEPRTMINGLVSFL